MLRGSSLLAMGKLYVLQRSDAADIHALSRGTRSATEAASRAPPPLP